MNQENYPKDITKENLPELVEQAKKEKWKPHIVMYGTVIIYSIVGFFVAPFLLSFSGQVVIGSYSPTNMPIHVWEKNNKQCFPLQGREAQVFHSVRAQTHEEISQRHSVYAAIISLGFVVIFEIFNLVLNWFQYTHPIP